MKQKLMFTACAAVVISSSVLALMQVESGSLMSSGKLQTKNEMGFASSDVSSLVKQLKKKYPHIKHPCIYGSAMVIRDKSDKIPTLLETETKCIHALVIAEGQESHLKQQTR